MQTIFDAFYLHCFRFRFRYARKIKYVAGYEDIHSSSTHQSSILIFIPSLRRIRRKRPVRFQRNLNEKCPSIQMPPRSYLFLRLSSILFPCSFIWYSPLFIVLMLKCIVPVYCTRPVSSFVFFYSCRSFFYRF